jgi:hypothetical protein
MEAFLSLHFSQVHTRVFMKILPAAFAGDLAQTEYGTDQGLKISSLNFEELIATHLLAQRTLERRLENTEQKILDQAKRKIKTKM